MILRIVVFLLVFGNYSLLGFANYEGISFVKNIEEEGWPVDQIDEVYLDDAEVITRMEKRIFTVSSPGQAVFNVHEVYTLLNENTGRDYISIYYDQHESLKKLEVKVYNAEGDEIEKYKKKDFQDRSAYDGSTIQSDTRFKILDLSRNVYPVTVELVYEKVYRGIMRYPDIRPQGYENSIENSEFTYVVPKEIELSYQSYGTEVEPEIETSSDTKTYTWAFNNLTAKTSEYYLGKDVVLLPRVGLAPSQFLVEGYNGSMNSWQEFSQFMYTLNKEQSQITPEISTLVKSLIAGESENRGKINKIYDYVKETMRYVSVQVGIGGWKAFDADYVQRNSFGDCKALTNYTMTLLKEAGIESKWALIRNGNNKGYAAQEGFVTPGSFNHVVLYIPSEDMWLECTSKSFPPGYIGSGNDDRMALLVDEKEGRLIRSPRLLEKDNLTMIEAEIVLDPNGLSVVNMIEKTKGEDHQRNRYITSNFSASDKEKNFLRRVAVTPVEIKKLEYRFEDLNPTAFETSEFTVSKIGSKSGPRMFLPVDPIRPLSISVDEDTSRVHDFYLKSVGNMTTKIKYIVPEGYSLESAPFDNVAKETKFGEYSFKMTEEGGSIFIERNYKFLSGDFPVEEFEDFVEFRKGFDKLVRSKFVLKKG